MRVLFATLPATGHAAPLCSIAAELALRGHTVGWVAHAELRDHLLPADATVWEALGPGSIHAMARSDKPLVALRAFFGNLLPAVNAAMLPTVRTAIAAFSPDVVVLEGNCLAGSIAARLAGLPWVVVQVTPVLLLQPFRLLPTVETWLAEQVAQIQRAGGVDPLPWPIRSPHGTLIASSAAFLGAQADLRPGDVFVGALAAHRGTPAAAFELGLRPRVLVTLGTLTGAAGLSFLDRAAEGLACLGGTTLLATPTAWLPVPTLMPHLDLVLCHGGQGTVTEALSHGVPLLVAPVQFDQPMVAARVAALGVGRVLSFAKATAADIGEAARVVLSEPRYAQAARAIGVTLGNASGGAAAAADRVLQAAR